MQKTKNKKFLLISLALLMSVFVLAGCSKVSLTGTTSTGGQNGGPANGGTPPSDGGTPPSDGGTPPSDGGSAPTNSGSAGSTSAGSASAPTGAPAN
jgi:hypothetical protein